MVEQNKPTSYYGIDKIGYVLIACGVIILTLIQLGQIDNTSPMFKNLIIGSTVMFTVGMLCVSIIYIIIPRNDSVEIGQ